MSSILPSSNVPKGSRKVEMTKLAGWQVVAIFVVYAWLYSQDKELPLEIVLVFLGAVGVNLGIYSKANVSVHQAQKDTPKPIAGP